MAMLLDGGIVTIYRQTDTAEPGEMPSYNWTEWWQSYFGEKTVGVNRYYIAMAHDDQIDLMIEVRRNREISPATDRAEIGGTYYRIVQVQHVLDEDGLPMTDLALERVSGLE